MAVFIVEQLTSYKKKLSFLWGVLKNRIALSELKNKITWSGLKNKINILICNANIKVKELRCYFSFTREDLNIDMLVRTIRKYPVPIAAVLALFTGLTLAGHVAAGAGFPANNALAKNSTADKNILIQNRGVPSSEINHSRRDYRAGGDISRGWINRNDTHLLAMVIEGEAADEPMAGKVAVGAVILNRTDSGKFPRNVRNVVYQPWAFESVMNGQYTRPLSRDSIRAADMAINGWDPTGGALYFWNPVTAKSKWVWQKPVTLQIGKHVFAK